MNSSFPILLVDDDLDLVQIIQRAFDSVFPEAKLIKVHSYKQAVTYLNGIEGYGPKLVLLDLDLLTGPSGYDLLRLMRLHPKGGLLPIVILSNNDSEDSIVRTYTLGANAYTIKPFDFAGWQVYAARIKEFWHMAATLPKLYFNESDQPNR